MATHKSSRGIPIDMAALAKKNELTRAVGNMNANGRGDIIDASNRVITSLPARVASVYNSSTVNSPPPSPPAVPDQKPSQFTSASIKPDDDELTSDELDLERDNEDDQ